MEVHRQQLFGMPLDVGATATFVLDQLDGKPVSLSYLNPLAWSVAASKPVYVKSLNSMDIVVCDGLGVQRAVKSVFSVSTPIVSLDYSGIGAKMLGQWAVSGDSVCLVGGTKEVNLMAKARIVTDFPEIEVLGAFEGYGNSLSEARRFILAHKPSVLLVGLGMGLQEEFLTELIDSGWVGKGICVGAFFDRLARPEIDYPAWSTKLNVRFLGNITRRPGYYLHRYGIRYWPFLTHYAKYRFRGENN